MFKSKMKSKEKLFYVFTLLQRIMLPTSLAFGVSESLLQFIFSTAAIVIRVKNMLLYCCKHIVPPSHLQTTRLTRGPF